MTTSTNKQAPASRVTFSPSARRQCRSRQRQGIGKGIVGALAGRIGARWRKFRVASGSGSVYCFP